MIRQALRSFAVWFFEHRDLHALRLYASEILLRVWPTCARSEIPESVFGVDRNMIWRCQDTALDINPDSGRAFVGCRMVRSEKWPIEQSGSTDLFAHLFPRPIKREPSLVMYAGAQTGLAGFVGGLLPRFFALDRLGVPKDILLLVSLDMGRTRIFQDALIDHIFAPRPLELMRKHRLVRVETLHEVTVPDLTFELLEQSAQRISEIYGPFATDGPPVILCGRGVQHSKALLRFLPEGRQSQAVVVDPFVAPLRLTLHALASASVVVAPNGEERALLALVPSRQRTLHEVAVYHQPDPLTQRILSMVEAVGAISYHTPHPD